MLTVALLISLLPISSITSCEQNSKKEALLKQLNPAIVFTCVYSDEHELGVWFVTQQSPAEVEAWFQNYTEQVLQNHYGPNITLSVNRSDSFIEISADSKESTRWSATTYADDVGMCLGTISFQTTADRDWTTYQSFASLARVDLQISQKGTGNYSLVKIVTIGQISNGIPGHGKLVIFPELEAESINRFNQALDLNSRL